MLTFYHAPQTRSGRTMWLLEESGLPFETRYVDVQRADGSGAFDPANVHPDGKVPAIVHHGAIIPESYAEGNPMAETSYRQVVRRLELALANGPYLMGHRFTAVDVMAGSTVAWARHVFPESAEIDAWLARITDRPAHQRACENDAEKVAA